jgi:hypothetical protein
MKRRTTWIPIMTNTRVIAAITIVGMKKSRKRMKNRATAKSIVMISIRTLPPLYMTPRPPP